MTKRGHVFEYTGDFEVRKGMENGCNYNINKKENGVYVWRKNE